MSRTEGAKYVETRDLRPVDVAALIRAELKTAAAASNGPLTGLKFSVRCRDYNAISVNVDGLADDQIHNIVDGRHRRTNRANAIADAVSKIGWAYNYDGSDPMSDYWDKRFFFTVSFLTAQDRERRAAEKAAKAGRRTASNEA